MNIHEAKTQLSRRVDQAAKGEPLIIAKSGKRLVKVTRVDAPADGQGRRLGFMAGQFTVPEDVDRIRSEEIADLFGITAE